MAKEKPSLRGRIGQLLDENPNMMADEAVEKLKGQGFGDADRIKKSFYNLKSERKKGSSRPAPAAARAKSAPSGKKAAPKVGTAGGGQAGASETVRQLEGVIRRCGGIDAVRQLLDAMERIGTR